MMMNDFKAYRWKLYEPVSGMWVGKTGAYTEKEKDAKVFSYEQAHEIQMSANVALVFRKVGDK